MVDKQSGFSCSEVANVVWHLEGQHCDHDQFEFWHFAEHGFEAVVSVGRRLPTTGDKVRLADTELFIELEYDLTNYGDEVKFGGGKVIRDGMGQSQISRHGGAVDTVITNAVVVDVTGIYKADIGLKDGMIHSIGKAGNPDTQDGVSIIIFEYSIFRIIISTY